MLPIKVINNADQKKVIIELHTEPGRRRININYLLFCCSIVCAQRPLFHRNKQSGDDDIAQHVLCFLWEVIVDIFRGIKVSARNVSFLTKLLCLTASEGNVKGS